MLAECAREQAEANRMSQSEELEALAAIYGDEVCSVVPDEWRCEVRLGQYTDVDGGTQVLATLRALLLPEYPSHAPPLVELDGCHLPPTAPDALAERALELHNAAPGTVLLFDLVEWVSESIVEPLQAELDRAHTSASDAELAAALTNVDLDDLQSAADESEGLNEPQLDGEEALARAQLELEEQLLQESCANARRRREDEAVAAMAKVVGGIVHGPKLTEKKSIFQAHVAPVKHVDDVEAVVAILLQDHKVAAATHNIMAYRIAQPNGVWAQDHDDDGETAAGKNLLHLMQLVDVVDVVVVVTRWYGGIHLGPDRFKIINNVARSLLDHEGYIKQKRGSKSSSSKAR